MAELGNILLTLARNAIASRLGQPTQPVGDSPELHAPGATFVTLTQHGQLRGCIGSLEAWRPLGQDVRENALAAAFRDPKKRPREQNILVCLSGRGDKDLDHVVRYLKLET